MREKRLLTAIVPFHDFENNFVHLKDLIGSIDSGIQVIIVCDALLSEEFYLVQSTFSQHQHITLLNGNFRSAGKSRNAGLQQSTTPWVVFWDCDDRVSSHRYLEMIESSDSEISDLLIGQIQTVDFRTDLPSTISRTQNILDLATYPAFTRVVFRRAFIKNERFPSFAQGEDQCFLAALLARDPEIRFFSSVVYYYRVNNPNQTTNKGFDFSSHFEVVTVLDDLLVVSQNKESRKALRIIRFRILISIVKRFFASRNVDRVGSAWRFFIALCCSPWLIRFARPKRSSILRESNLPTLILVGGLGNQIFQYAYMVSKFGKGKFRINANLGNPRTSQMNAPEISSFYLDEVLLLTRSMLTFKSAVCNYLLILSSHGNTDLVSRVAFGLIQCINTVYSWFHNGVGLVFLANGVGYFEDYGNRTSYKYYVGCFHSYKWKEFQNESGDFFTMRLKIEPDWLIDILKQSKSVKFGTVHIRRGDYLDISNLGFLTISYFQNLMETALETNKVEEFLIFSDDPEYVRAELSQDIIRKSRIVSFEQSNASANLMAMTAGRYFILSNSTFSWWGAALSPFEDKTVIAPKSWFADNSRPREIYPVNWILKEVS